MNLPIAWFLNFDADLELAQPDGYTPPSAVRSRHGALRERVKQALLGPGDIALEEGRFSRVGPQYRGRAWCPTPRALAALRAAGVVMPASPPLEVLRAVNHRRFSADLGPTLPSARYAASRAEIEEVVSSGRSPTGQWLLKRPFSFAGRGRLRLAQESAPQERARAAAWIEASLRDFGGLMMEPFVTRAGDFGAHGYLSRAGVITLGEPTRQRCDDRGAWISSERAAPGDLSAEERRALMDEARRAGGALYEAGYYGPFGVDAFRYEDGAGGRAFNPRCEINARLSMGWAVGMGSTRPDREEP